MTIEQLKTQIAELLQVTDSEKNLAFIFLKNKISNTLENDEAIKINGLGVFQLKEQFAVSSSKKKSSKSKPVIIFSPTEKNNDESLFITLTLEPTDSDSMELDESVFNLGIDKPVIQLDKTNAGNDNNLEKKIEKIIEDSERIENFDLWDDYLDKQAATILPNEETETTDLDSYLNSEESGLNEDDFMELDENELLSEFEDSERSDEKEEIVSEEDNQILQNDLLTDESMEPANEVLEDIPFEEEITTKADENIFYESETPEENNNTENAESETDMEKEAKEEVKEEQQNTKNEFEEKQYTAESKVQEEIPVKKKNIMHKPKYSPTIYALIAAFFIVGAIGIYYLFFNNPTWLYDQNEIEIKLQEQHQREFEEAKRKAKLLAKKQNVKKDNINKNQQIEEKNKIKENNKQAITGTEKNRKEKEQSSVKSGKTLAQKIEKKLKDKITKENSTEKTSVNNVNRKKVKLVEEAKNIYFNGVNYTLQISSWPRKILAEKEVERIRNKGYNAYIMKAYIPRYQKNWYRVRIGSFPTLRAAKKAQRELK